MSDSNTQSGLKIRIPDVTKPERTELVKVAPPGMFELIDRTLGEGQHGELLTATAVAWLTKVAVGVLVAWLLKTTDRKKFRKLVIIEKPDGTTIKVQVEIDQSRSESPEAQALSQINGLLSSEGLPKIEG